MRESDLAEIKSATLFSGLSDSELEEVLEVAKRKPLQKGRIIFHQGDVAEGFYVLVKGRVKIFKVNLEGKEQILQFVSPGYPFAEAALFVGKTYPASAEVVEDGIAYFFASDDFKRLIKTRPTIALNMIITQATYLRRHARTIEDLSLKEVSGRLAGYILEHSGAGDSFKLDISKTQLASRLGTVSETLSRTFAKMKEQGLIATEGKYIKIQDRKGLEKLLLGEQE